MIQPLDIEIIQIIVKAVKIHLMKNSSNHIFPINFKFLLEEGFRNIYIRPPINAKLYREVCNG